MTHLHSVTWRKRDLNVHCVRLWLGCLPYLSFRLLAHLTRSLSRFSSTLLSGFWGHNMTGAAAIESRSKDLPLANMESPLASDTPSAVDNRVFFGPLQSPEKKFALSLSGPKFRTPVRRSTRLSSAMVPLPLFSEEHEYSSTREGTPEEDTIPDGAYGKFQ